MHFYDLPLVFAGIGLVLYTVLAGEYARVAGHALPALYDRKRPRLPKRQALRGLLAPRDLGPLAAAVTWATGGAVSLP